MKKDLQHLVYFTFTETCTSHQTGSLDGLLRRILGDCLRIQFCSTKQCIQSNNVTIYFQLSKEFRSNDVQRLVVIAQSASNRDVTVIINRD